MIATFFSNPAEGEVVAAHRVHPQQRPARRRAELHDHLEPLRAPRLPVQPNGPTDEQAKTVKTTAGRVR